MIISVRTVDLFSVEHVGDISSFVLYDPLGSPELIGLEYFMPEGTAWTLASIEDKDFYKILNTSGILHTEIPGNRLGTSNLLCTPVLRKGVPRWFCDVDRFLASTEDRSPFFLAHRASHGTFCGVYHNDPAFKDRVHALWNQRQ